MSNKKGKKNPGHVLLELQEKELEGGVKNHTQPLTIFFFVEGLQVNIEQIVLQWIQNK